MPEPQKPHTTEDRHQPQLDGVRGLAILAVLVAHGINFLPLVPLDASGPLWSRLLVRIGLQGWGGVDLFFVLSGFLITGILLRAREAPAYYKPFYMRRLLRIAPIYYLFLLVTLALAALTHLPALDVPLSPRSWLPFFFYLQNWPLFWPSWAHGIGGLWGIFWSLAVEEQFYLLWPALVRRVQLRALFAVCIVGFLLGLPERLILMHHVGVQVGILQWPFSRLDGLFLGAAIALYATLRARPVPLRWAVIAFTAGAAIFAWIALLHSQELLGSGVHIWSFGVTAFALISSALVILTQHSIPAPIRLLTLPILRTAGRLSYGMYVYHLLIYRLLLSIMRRLHLPSFPDHPSLFATLLILTLAIAAVMAVAELSFRYFETPFLRLKRLFPTSATIGRSRQPEQPKHRGFSH